MKQQSAVWINCMWRQGWCYYHFMGAILEDKQSRNNGCFKHSVRDGRGD